MPMKINDLCKLYLNYLSICKLSSRCFQYSRNFTNINNVANSTVFNTVFCGALVFLDIFKSFPPNNNWLLSSGIAVFLLKNRANEYLEELAKEKIIACEKHLFFNNPKNLNPSPPDHPLNTPLFFGAPWSEISRLGVQLLKMFAKTC